MEKVKMDKKQIDFNSSLKEFTDYFSNDFKPLNCQLNKHKHRYSLICLDKRCLK